MSNNGQMVVQAGQAGVALAVVGVPAVAVAATGGAAAVVLVGYGLYKWLDSDSKKDRKQ